MKITQSFLSVFLVLQIVAAGALLFHQRSTASVRPDEKLLTIDVSTINKMIIEDAEASVELNKDDTGWQLPNYDVPVSANKAESVLDSLAAAKTGWAVANREESHSQLEVAEDSFNRKIALFNNEDKIAELFIGSSPGLRRSHVRRSDDSDVYSVALNSYDIPAIRNQWFDRNILALPEISTIQLMDHTLEADGEGWKITDGDGESQTPDQPNIDSVVNTLKTLRVSDVKESTEDDRVANAEVLVKNDESDYTYTFYASEDNYLVRRSDQNAVFEISKADYEAIAMVDVATLIKAEEQEEEPAIEKSEATTEEPSQQAE